MQAQLVEVEIAVVLLGLALAVDITAGETQDPGGTPRGAAWQPRAGPAPPPWGPGALWHTTPGGGAGRPVDERWRRAARGTAPRGGPGATIS